MCMMCEQEALYDAYLEYVARKEAEAAAKGDTMKGASGASTAFKAEAIDDATSEDLAPDELTVVRAPPVAAPKDTTSKEN